MAMNGIGRHRSELRLQDRGGHSFILQFSPYTHETPVAAAELIHRRVVEDRC
jgi:hypothetical protein